MRFRHHVADRIEAASQAVPARLVLHPFAPSLHRHLDLDTPVHAVVVDPVDKLQASGLGAVVLLQGPCGAPDGARALDLDGEQAVGRFPAQSRPPTGHDRLPAQGGGETPQPPRPNERRLARSRVDAA
jgi:hypothetical protein